LITLFDHQSTAMKSARFQVATAQRGTDGLLEIALVAFDLKSKVAFTQVLFFKFKKSATDLRYARGSATIYEARLRPTGSRSWIGSPHIGQPTSPR
jgi:hypothetical protein